MQSETEKAIRENCLNKIDELVQDYEISKKIEEGIYQYVVEEVCKAKNLPILWDKNFKRPYMNKCISIYSNLNQDSYIHNADLLEKIQNSEIDPYRLAFLTPQELFPQHWNDLLLKKEAKDNFLYTKKHLAYTEDYRCGKCKYQKCSYFECQTRSGDEPMTIFLTCLNCGNKWKC